jgi:hypothetical protein
MKTNTDQGPWRLSVVPNQISFARETGPFPCHTGAYLKKNGKWCACPKWEKYASALGVSADLIEQARRAAV